MISRTQSLVVLNPLAHGGRGARRFERVRPLVESTFEAKLVVGQVDGAWKDEVRGAVDHGVRVFIAAGGDGTAHALLNALIEAPRRPALDALTLGAVGLGSSNDLHKPVHRRVDGVPVRIDALRAAPRDIVRCTHVDASGSHQACVLVSASLGVTACANARFSESTATPRVLRRISTTTAIAWAATRTLASWRNMPASVCVNHGELTRIALSSLSILKTEWLSGRLRYGDPIDPASGDFDVALTEGLGRTGLLLDILALLSGHFNGRPGHQRLRARSLGIWLDREAPLELDGEIVRAREAHFDMFPERIRLCA